MGDRGHLLRALSAALAAIACAGCLDFVEPELPERGAPAVAQVAVVLTDSASLTVTGTLAPGFDDDGLRRDVLDARVAAAGDLFEPSDTLADGSFRYATTRPFEPGAMETTIEIRTPRVASTSPNVIVNWPGLRRLDGDTVRRGPDGSVRLHVELVPAGPLAEPRPATRQWFLTLAGEEGTFRLSADGPPPTELDIPARWLPDGRVSARLIYQQSARVQPEPDYVNLITLDLRVHWTIPSMEPMP